MSDTTTAPLETAAAGQPRCAVAPRWWPALVLAAGIALLLAGIAWLTFGKPLAEKTLTALVTPVGSVWLVTSGRAIQLIALGRALKNKMLIAFWLGLWLCGTGPLQSTLTGWLERSVAAYDPREDADLDVLVVLGGGTSSGPWRAQAAKAGDRVLMAAELFHQGHARQLITTGEATPGVSRSLISPAEQTVEIWTKLDIPPSAITTIGGQNTAAELANLKRIWPQLQGKRVGLLTSALHLPRAMRLARAQQLVVIPVAADVRWSPAPWSVLDIIPQANNFTELAAVQHELMAYLVRR